MHPLLLPLATLALESPPQPTPDDLLFAARQSRFAIELYRELAATPGNLVCSPFSLQRALAMARAGAAGETAREMDATLHLTGDYLTRFAALAGLLEAPSVGRKEERRPAYSLEIAAALFGHRSTPFEPDFLRRMKDGFASEMHTVDFARSEEARATINGWTAEHTRQRILEIIPPGLLTGDTRLVLVDTIHFLGAWQEPFQEGRTAPMPFIRVDGSTVETPTMRATKTYGYGETERAQVLELAYERGAASMVVVLPKAGHSLADVAAQEDFTVWTKALGSRQVDVWFPKYEFRFARRLDEDLKKLGMPTAFIPGRADFSGMLKDPLHIGAVLQEAFVAVDEKGTEAAAATAVVMVKSAAKLEPEPPVTFRADRPFLFFIRHRATGLVLFAGRVVDPKG